jgi:capsular polysaccharide biosynthesis protein
MLRSLKLSTRAWLRQFPGLCRLLKLMRRVALNFVAACLRVVVPRDWRWGPPKGFYSDFELLQKKLLRGRVYFGSQPTPLIAPDSLRKVCGYQQDKNQPWPFFWTYHPQARLIGTSLVRLDDRKRLSLEGAFGPIAAAQDPAYRTVFLPRPTQLTGNWTSVVAQWGQGYYHWLMDALPRLILLPEFPEDTRIIVPAELAAFQLETLEWMGLQNRFRPTAETHLLIEHYYFSSTTSMTGCYNPFAVQWLRGLFLKRADASYDPPRRFYLRRVGKIRPLLNEQDLLQFFQERGWDVVDTEQLSMARQIQLFSRAEMVVAQHGAGLTNLLWCQPRCRVLELCPSTYLNGVFEGLAQCVGADHRYLVCKGDFGLHSTVDLKMVAKALDSSWLPIASKGKHPDPQACFSSQGLAVDPKGNEIDMQTLKVNHGRLMKGRMRGRT